MPDAAHRLLRSLTDPFRDGHRVAWAVLLGFLLINAIVLANAVLHDPRIGYDAGAHLKYAITLASGRWPGVKDSQEFFSPPLPYVPTALLWASLDAAGSDGRAELALKLAQLVQVAYSIVLTFFVAKIARLVRPGAFTAGVALLCLGLVPAYYRTFAMIRGEPLLATLAVVGTYLTLRTYAFRRPTLGSAVFIGITLGLAVNSRQWAFFVLPALGAVGLWRLIVDAPNRGATVRAGLVTLAVFFVVGSPFYLHLHRTYGSMRAFNREPQADDATTRPAETTISMADALASIATHPVRDTLAGHGALIFYADVWGDYWQYYLVWAKDRRGNYPKAGGIERVSRDPRPKGSKGGSNYATMPPYLGRVAVAGVVPTLAFLIGTIAGLAAIRRAFRRDADAASVIRPTLALCVLCTLAGYTWFVTSYPNDHGDTIKSSYPLQLYAPLAILAAASIASLRDRWPRTAWVVVAVLLIVAIHAMPACISRYI